MNYALIIDGVVRNIIRLHPTNAALFPNAVPMNSLPVAIGDTYEDGIFYRNGEKVITMEERLRLENEDMLNALTILGVIPDE